MPEIGKGEPRSSPLVNEALTRQVADLARLELSDQEVKTFTAQLGQILGYVEQLQGVDLKINGQEVEPLTHPLDVTATPMREDQMRPSPKSADGRPKVLLSAPDEVDGGFKVPPIL